MDQANLFSTPFTARHLRAEFAVALLVAVVLAVLHLGEINWWAFVALFGYIDVLGYLPGVVWRARHPGAPVPRVFYVLYNVMHSGLTAAAVGAAFALIAGPQWALLALPIHLCGDRAIFGNFAKPFGVAFEPEPHPAYLRFVSDYRASTAPAPSGAAAPAAAEELTRS